MSGYISLRDIALRAGVSVATVSMALRNSPRISTERRAQIQQLATEMGYRPAVFLSEAMHHVRQRSIAAFRSEIAFLSDEQNPHWPGASGKGFPKLQAFARQLGYSLDLVLRPKVTARTLRRRLKSRNIRGLLISLNTPLSPDFITLLQDFACVSLGGWWRYQSPLHYADVDRFRAGQRSMLEALRRGYKKIGYVGGRSVDPGGQCLAGARSAVPANLVFEFCASPRKKRRIAGSFCNGWVV